MSFLAKMIVYCVQKRLQDPTMNVKEAATDIESLEQEFVKLRDDLSQAAVENAKTKCTVWGDWGRQKD